MLQNSSVLLDMNKIDIAVLNFEGIDSSARIILI